MAEAEMLLPRVADDKVVGRGGLPQLRLVVETVPLPLPLPPPSTALRERFFCTRCSARFVSPSGKVDRSK